jgi:hypothetical protein
MEAISSFETLVETQRTTRRHIPEDDTLQKRLMSLMSKKMMGEQRSTDGDILILVVLSQNVQHPYSQLLDLTHRLQSQITVAWSQPISLANSEVV